MTKPKNDLKDVIVEPSPGSVDIPGGGAESRFIEEIRRGDQEAFRRLVVEYTGRLRDYVSQWLDRREDAEEAVQEVFLYIWEHRADLRCESLPMLFKYIYIAARTQSIRILRERQRDRKYQEYAQVSSPAYAEAPDARLEVLQTELLIRHALQRMPHTRAAVYDMRCNRGMSYKEISEELHITESTVRSHVNHAIGDIKKVLSAG